MKTFHLAALGTVFLVLSTPGFVHHSGAAFDRSRQVKITGTVTEFVWANPHATFRIDVVGADGKTESWPIEMNGPSNLIHEGWKRSTIKPGDKVTVTVNPLRDGRLGGWYVAITLQDGTTLSTGDPPAGGESSSP
jgi:hypothetical protein